MSEEQEKVIWVTVQGNMPDEEADQVYNQIDETLGDQYVTMLSPERINPIDAEHLESILKRALRQVQEETPDIE